MMSKTPKLRTKAVKTGALRKRLAGLPPTGVQKRSIMPSNAERGVLNSAAEQYRTGQSEPILVGGRNVLKPALKLMAYHRLDDRRGPTTPK